MIIKQLLTDSIPFSERETKLVVKLLEIYMKENPKIASFLYCIGAKKVEECDGVLDLSNLKFKWIYDVKGSGLMGAWNFLTPNAIYITCHSIKNVDNYDGRYDYIETGSLVSIKANVSDIVIPSEERHIKMYPLDFEEFLWANGNETLMPLIRQSFIKQRPLGDMIHRKAMDYFRQYLIIGGMPQAVKEYAENKNFVNVDAIKRDILTLYRADIIKHAKGYERKVEAIFDEIPSQLQKHEKRFNLASIGKQARFREYEDAMFWLEDAMIVNICYNSTAPSAGLKMNSDRMTLKCYMADTGLLISHAFDENSIVSEEVYKKLLLGKLEFNEGMIVENIVAQMLVASDHRLYFYSNPSRDDASERMEIDFLIAKQKITSRHNISPLEVKSGKGYTLTSLQKFRQKFAQQLHTPYVLHSADVMEKDGIVCLPLYMTPLL